MWYYYLLYGVFGWLMALLVLGLIIVMIACWCCGVSLDSLTTWGEENAMLTCFHCGQETPANRKTCEHCDGELQ